MRLDEYRKLSREERKEFRRTMKAQQREARYEFLEHLFSRFWLREEPKIDVRDADHMTEYATERLIRMLDPDAIGELEQDTLRRELIVVIEHIIEWPDHKLSPEELKLVTERVLDHSLGQGISELKARCRATPQYKAAIKRQAWLKAVSWISWPMFALLFWAIQPMMIYVTVMLWACERVGNLFVSKENRTPNHGMLDGYLSFFLGLERPARS